MTDKQINKWLRRQFSPIGWVLIGYFLLMNAFVSVQAVVDIAKQFLQNAAAGTFLLDFDTTALMNNVWGYAVSIAVGALILYAWKGRDYWQKEIFHREKKLPVPVFLCCLCLLMGCQMISSLWLTVLELIVNCFGSSILPALESVSGSTPTFGMFLYSALLAPLSEEILFRGYVLRSLRPYGSRFAIVGSAVLFALFHGNLLQGPYALLAGLILGYLACEYSLWWAIGAHVFNNLILAEGLSRLAQLLPYPASDVVPTAMLAVCLAVSVIILKANRQKIREYTQGEWIDRRCVRCLFTNWGCGTFALAMSLSMILWLCA